MDTVIMASQRLSVLEPRAGGLAAIAASEDSSTEGRIAEFCRNLSHQLGVRNPVTHQVWLLSELRMPQLRAIAARDAAAADMLLVAVHHADSLPDELAAWLELWLAQKRKRTRLLVALFDPVYSGISLGLRARLEDVAKQGRLEFLVHTEESSED